MVEYYSIVWRDHILFILHLLMDRWLVSTFGYCEHAAVNNGVQFCLNICLQVFGKPWSGIPGSHGDSMFGVLRNCQAVFHFGCTSSASPAVRLDSGSGSLGFSHLLKGSLHLSLSLGRVRKSEEGVVSAAWKALRTWP